MSMELFVSQTQSAFIHTVALTGTHSAGKSTTLNAIHDCLEPFDSNDELVGDIHPDIRIRSLRIGNVIVPVILNREAAEGYVKWMNDPSLMAENYTLAGQVNVETRGMGSLDDAYLYGEHFSEKIQTGVQNRLAIVVADRTPLDGLVYAEERLGDSQETISLADVTQDTGYSLVSPIESGKYNFKAEIESKSQSGIQHAYVLNPHEVAFEQSAMRQNDLAFRERIHDAMLARYRATLGKDQVSILSGSVEQRAQIVMDNLSTIALIHLQVA